MTEDANGRNVMVWNVIQNKNGIMINANKSKEKQYIAYAKKIMFGILPPTWLCDKVCQLR